MALTKVSGDILDSGISVAGVVTATKFDGPMTGSSGTFTGIVTATGLDLNGNADISGITTFTGVIDANATTQSTSSTTGAATFAGGVGIVKNLNVGGDVSIGGTLTYEDVLNIDSVGIVTAREGIFIPDTKQLQIGNAAGSADLKVFHSADINQITTGLKEFQILGGGSNNKKVFATNTGSSGNNSARLYFDNSLKLETSTTGVTVTGTVTDSNGNLRSIPLQNETGAHVLAATAAGRVIYISTGGVTVNPSVFSGGEAVTIINNSGSAQTITQGSSMTLHFTSDGTSGNRTLGARGMATVWFAANNIAYISGSGLT